MKSRLHAPLAVLALTSLVMGQESTVLTRMGDEALAAGLWEIAADHFERCLNLPGLSAEKKSEAAVRLAEAWIREKRFAEAYQILGQSFVTKSPEAQFWKGQALVGLGQFSEAVAALQPLTEGSGQPHFPESVLTISNLQLALGKPESALATLQPLVESADPQQAARAGFQRAAILLDLGRSAEAKSAMPPLESLNSTQKPRAIFIEAHLALREGRNDEAIAGFQSLLDPIQPYHPAALGLVDAYRAAGANELATSFLLSFIQNNPESPELGALFERLLAMLPAKPTLHDPILDRIEKDWFTPGKVPSQRLISDPDGPAGGDDLIGEGSPSELLAYSLFTRAVGLMRMDTPASQAESRRLFNRLRTEYPEHPLAARSLLEQARWNLQHANVAKALDLLSILRNFTTIHEVAGESAFIEARTAYQNGETRRAVQLFDEAARLLNQKAADAARLNSALITVTTGAKSGSTQADPPADPAIRASLELERALSETDSGKRRKALEEFLSAHPDHERAAEARLAAAECALGGSEIDLSFARAQLDTLNAEPEKSAKLSKSRLALVKLHIEDLSGDSTNAIQTANSIIDSFPEDPAAADALLVLGRNQFQAQSYNEARLSFEKLAASDSKNPERAQAAWLLAARSAALVSTRESRQAALILFDNAIKAQGSLSSVAKLERARLMIDMNLLPESVAYLKSWFDTLKEADPLYFPVGFLLAESISKQGGARPDALANALAVYDRLLARSEKQPLFYNRIQYLRGCVLEQMPDPKDPTRMRDREALAAFYSVLETNTPPGEWEAFENCGFGALRLLRNAGRWPAAVACARKIASFNGPRAKEASDLASKIQLEHQIWED